MDTYFTVFKSIWSKDGLNRLLIVTITSLFVLGCSNDDNGDEFDYSLEGDNLSIADITGNWTATFAEFELLSDSNSTIELVSQGGNVTLNIQSNGRFTSTIGFPGEAAEQFSGQLGFFESLLVLLDDEDEPGDEAFLNINLTSDDVLEVDGILELDFDSDGSFEDTFVDLRMVR
ncbi:hypothetical protein [Flagellimonas meridianipacifica]|uniref:Lipocalin-like protein n=1 Tax=Flagellimonas meridianipacifica TaxID=1080225 RepID=A0A2T0MJZ9_9FLAO|nr:hypothetical protein [Allomuricauda pacifica]PRX57902.1 hypothetical protein CLV81_1916 [Allomuricauda pacifica]